MRIVDGQKILSPSDLVSFSACGHLTELERAAAAKLVKKPIYSDPGFELLLKRGREHEEWYLAELEAGAASPGWAVGGAQRLTRISLDQAEGLAGVLIAARETELDSTVNAQRAETSELQGSGRPLLDLSGNER